MEERRYNGKILYRYIHIQGIILLIFIVNLGLNISLFEKDMIGRSILLFILFLASLSFSYSENVIISNDYLIFENPIIKSKRLYDWNEIVELNETVENLVDGIMKITIRFLDYSPYS